MATTNNYEQFLYLIFTNAVDLQNDTLKVALMSPSYSFDATQTSWASVSANEIANGNGYTDGGETITTATITQSAGSVKFTCDNPSWVASGGDIGPAESAVIYADVTNKPLLFLLDFETSITAVDGATLELRVSSVGLFDVQG